MRQFITQYRKEFFAYFYGFNAYAILGIYSVLSLLSALYSGEYFMRERDVMNAYFILQPFVLILIIPTITMRVWAEEIKSGTIELLLTQPISYHTLTLAKFLAAYSFFIVMVTFSIPLFIVSHKFFVLDLGLVCSAYLGLLLCGSFFTAVGCCLSNLCRNNIISYVVTIFFLFMITQFNFGDIGGEKVFLPLNSLNFNNNYTAFLSGIVSWGNIIYFLCGMSLFLWLNIFMLNHRQTNADRKQNAVVLFVFLLLLIFFSTVTGFHLLLPREEDLTTTKRYTLLTEHADYLRALNKRVNITLYEAKIKRDEENSNYAALADYVERLLKRIQQYSMGNVRYEISRIESLSASERQLIQENIPYEEDGWGNKIYMVADFSDNDGNHQRISSFNNLRQNLIETDILRSLHLLDLEKKNIAILATTKDLKHLEAFNSTLQEFYNVTYLDSDIFYIPATYDAVIAINPSYTSIEMLLAFEQYIMNGGSLILFHEPLLLSEKSNLPIIHFLNTYGIKPITPSDNKLFTTQFDKAIPTTQPLSNNISSVILYGAGELQTTTSPHYQTTTLLDVKGKSAAVKSFGKYATNFPEIAVQSELILSFSSKEGNIFFVYDSDILHDDILTSDISDNSTFYQMVPLTDNILFLLRLVDEATHNQTEADLSYRRHSTSDSSIGIAIFKMVQKHYEKKIHNLTQQLAEHHKQHDHLKNMIQNNGYASAKQIGNINSISKKIDDLTDELNRTNKLLSQEYQSYILALAILLILVIPTVILFILWLVIFCIRKYRLNKIRRLIANV